MAGCDSEGGGEPDALHLPRRPLGDLRDDDDPARHLEVREVLRGEGLELMVGRAPAFVQHHGRRHLLPEGGVGHGEGHGLMDAGVVHQHLVHLRRRDLLASAVDELLQAARDPQVSLPVQDPLITGTEPAVVERVGVGVGLGAAAGLKALMRKGKIKQEPINVIAFCGDGGGADMGLSAISATLTHPDYNLLILMYDNESYANTDIQLSGSTPYGAHTTFSPPGKLRRIMHHRWKKNMAGMIAAGHPTCRFVGTVCMSYPIHAMNSVRKALSIGGPTFIHSLDPCPKGWDYDPMQSHELGELAVQTGIWPLYEVEDGVLKLVGKTRDIAEGRAKRRPVKDYLLRQGRFAHFTDEDLAYFQSKVDESWDRWLIPGVIPFKKDLEESHPPA